MFNPSLQGEKFDSDGEYTKKYVRELKDMPKQYLFKPWVAPDRVLKSCGVKLGKNYPYPIVDLKYSRDAAIGSYKRLKGSVL